MYLCSPSETTSLSPPEEIANTIWNPKTYYLLYKSSPLASILNQLNSVHITSTYLSNIFLLLFSPFNVGLPRVFWLPHNNFVYIYSFSYVLHALLISKFWSWSLYLYSAKNTTYEAPPYTVFSNLSNPNIHNSAPCSHLSSVHVLSLISETKFHT
jgi:hypothetical protein